MPNMKELCRITDALIKGLAEVRNSVADLTRRVDMLGFFSGSGQAAEKTPAPPPPANPVIQTIPPPAPAPAEPQRRPGPHVMHGMDDVFEGHEKQASERKRREFRDVYGNEETESEMAARIANEIFKEKYAYEIDHIEIESQSDPSKKKKDEFKNPMDDMKKMVEESKAEFRKAIDDYKKTAKEDMSNMSFNLLSNVFGRRIVNMLSPEKLHGGDLLYMYQNVRWIDDKVQAVMKKSISEKVASGQMTQAQAEAAGGFVSKEALGAQLAGGALIGLFIAKHIPKLVEMSKDVLELKDSVNTMMSGRRDFGGSTILHEKLDAWTSTHGAWVQKTEDMIGSRTILGMKVDTEGVNRLRDSMRTIMANDKFLDSAIKHYTENAADSTVFRTGFRRAFTKIWKFQ